MNNIDWDNKQQVLAAVKKNGYALQYASEKFKNDKDVILAAVNKNGNALRLASEIFKNDKDVVLAAVNQHGDALFYTSKDLKNDNDIVISAVTQNGSALQYASENLQNDLELLNLLKKYYNSPENKIEDEDSDIQQWFEERMNIRNVLFEQKLMQESIPNKDKKVKSRKLKF